MASYVDKYYADEKQADDEILCVAGGDIRLAQIVRGWRVEDFYTALVRRIEDAEKRERMAANS